MGCECSNKIRIAPTGPDRAMHSLIITFLKACDHEWYPLKQEGMIPYMDLRGKKTLFHDPDNCHENVWNNYFVQPELAEGELFCRERVNDYQFPDLRIGNLRHFNELSEKWLVYQPHILNKVNSFVEQNWGEQTAAIHIRGTDSYFDISRPHLPVGYYVDMIDTRLQDYDKILLCTDQQESFDFFKDRYGNRIIGYDAYRKRMEDDYRWCISNKDIEGYKAGEDVIIECLLMSKCDLLLKTFSNITTCALIERPELRAQQVDLLFWDEQVFRVNSMSVHEAKRLYGDQYERRLEIDNVSKYIDMCHNMHRKIKELRDVNGTSEILSIIKGYITDPGFVI